MNDLPVFERQDADLIYPSVLWNRPVARNGAGRFLVPGGHTSDFSLITALYGAVMASGAGECVTALPDVMAKLLGGSPGTTFVSSSPSGSLGREALARLVELSESADAVMLGANLSNNSLTTVLIERLLNETDRPIIAFGDALVSLRHNLALLTARQKTLLIITMPEVFTLSGALGIPISIRPGGGIINKLEIIRDLAAASQCDYAVYGSEVIVASHKKLGITPVNYRLGSLPALYYGALGVFWTQNLSRQYEGLMTGGYILSQVAKSIIQGPEHRPNMLDGVKAVSNVLTAQDDASW